MLVQVALSKNLAVQIACSTADTAPELTIVLDTTGAQVSSAGTSISRFIVHNLSIRKDLPSFDLMQCSQSILQNSISIPTDTIFSVRSLFHLQRQYNLQF
jgi:hypothetical protein